MLLPTSHSVVVVVRAVHLPYYGPNLSFKANLRDLNAPYLGMYRSQTGRCGGEADPLMAAQVGGIIDPDFYHFK